MSEITINKRKRTARASQLQLTKMIDFFNLTGLAEGKFNALHGKEEAKRKWAELATELNTLQGATKTVDQWQVVWRDLKSRVSIKVKELRKAKALTGNKPITQSELSDFELRVLGIVGAEYVEGHTDCPESIPDEENLLEELEHGNISVLSKTLNVITVCPSTSKKISAHSICICFNLLDDNDDDSIINDKSLHYTRKEYEDSEAIQNDNNVDNTELIKKSKVSIISSSKKKQ